MSYNGTLQTHNNTLQEILTKINELPTKEITPDGTLTITENGEHDVTYYEKADVQVSRRIGAFNVAVGQDLSGFVWLIDTSTLWNDFKTEFNLPSSIDDSIVLLRFSTGAPLLFTYNDGTIDGIRFWSGNTTINNDGYETTPNIGYSVGNKWGSSSLESARTNIIGYRFPEGTTITYVNPDYDVQGMINYLYQHSPY